MVHWLVIATNHLGSDLHVKKTPVLTPCLTLVMCLYCCTCYTTSCVYVYMHTVGIGVHISVAIIDQCAYMSSVCMCAYTRRKLELITREQRRYLVFALMYNFWSTSYKHVLIISCFSLLAADLFTSHLSPPSFLYTTTLHLFLSVHLSACLPLNLFLSSRFRLPPPSPLQDPLWSLPPPSQLLLEPPNR